MAEAKMPDTPMADDKAKETLPENLDKVRAKLEALTKELQKKISDEVLAVEKLDDTDSGIAEWLGNHVFRPGNEERLEDAKKALDAYKGALQAGVEKAKEVLVQLGDLGVVQVYMSKWKEAITALLPITILKLTFPDLDMQSVFVDYHFKKSAFNTVMTVLGALTAAAPEDILEMLAVVGIASIIGGIIAGEQNKDLYNGMHDKAKAAKTEVDEKVIKPLDTMLANVAKFWNDVDTALIAADYLKQGQKSPLAITNGVKFLATRATSYATALGMFNAFTATGPVDEQKLQECGRAAAVGLTQSQDPPQDAINEFILAYYLRQKQLNVPEIAKLLKIDEKEARKLQAKQMLDEGKVPAEIAKILEMPENQVHKIKEAIDLAHGK